MWPRGLQGRLRNPPANETEGIKGTLIRFCFTLLILKQLSFNDVNRNLIRFCV